RHPLQRAYPRVSQDAATSRHTRMAAAVRRWWDRWFIQAPICYAFYNGFEWVRSQVEGTRLDAVVHARHIISTERLLHIFHEARVEQWILPCAPACNPATTSALARDAIRFWNVYYGLMHFVVPALALIYLYHWH